MFNFFYKGSNLTRNFYKFLKKIFYYFMRFCSLFSAFLPCGVEMKTCFVKNGLLKMDDMETKLIEHKVCG